MAVVGKRKRGKLDNEQSPPKKTLLLSSLDHQAESNNALANGQNLGNGVRSSLRHDPIAVQIVTGSYERTLHGVCATISRNSFQPTNPPDPDHDGNVTFTDTFLFAAHTSSIRCLAISPSTDDSNKRTLATGSSDERITLYNLSTAPPPQKPSHPSLPTLPGTTGTSTTTKTAENPQNRILGTLTHHERPITALHFPTKSKLFSAAADNTLSITRTRDWTLLSSIKAPMPKPQGRPSGDTAGPGELPAGINDFAVHPSQKLMLSVGRGERCMRLWNLMTGRKAGVLNFEREVLARVGEGRFGGAGGGGGEGRRVVWDESGENFVVGFERGAVLFGIDSKAKAIVRPAQRTRVHQMRFPPRSSSSLSGREQSEGGVLAVSTEDGRVLFYDTRIASAEEESVAQSLPSCVCLAELGGEQAGISGRVKDFEILRVPPTSTSQVEETSLLIITGSSDGAIRLWVVSEAELVGSRGKEGANGESREVDVDVIGDGAGERAIQVGTLIGTLETGNRITCLGAFVMDGTAAGAVEDVLPGVQEDEESSESDSESAGSV